MIHTILWCSESGDSNTIESDTQNALWLWNLQNHCCENTALSLPPSCAEVSSCSRSLSCSKTWLFYKSNLVASWMHLYNFRCFLKNLRMLFQSLRALCLAPGGPGSIWNHLGAPVRSTGVSGKSACGFQTNLHFADVVSKWRPVFPLAEMLLAGGSQKP